MYNGIGLITPRGSGTNGHVQRNFAVVRKREKINNKDYLKADQAIRQPNKAILDHARKRKLELKYTEYADMLDEQGLSQEEIDFKLESYRAVLQLNDKEEQESEKPGREILKETHHIAEANLQKNSLLRQAFGISEHFVEGTSFNPERREREAQLRAALQQNKNYQLIRSPSPSSEIVSDLEKKSKNTEKDADSLSKRSNKLKKDKDRLLKAKKKSKKKKEKKRKKYDTSSSSNDSSDDSDDSGSSVYVKSRKEHREKSSSASRKKKSKKEKRSRSKSPKDCKKAEKLKKKKKRKRSRKSKVSSSESDSGDESDVSSASDEPKTKRRKRSRSSLAAIISNLKRSTSPTECTKKVKSAKKEKLKKRKKSRSCSSKSGTCSDSSDASKDSFAIEPKNPTTKESGRNEYNKYKDRSELSNDLRKNNRLKNEDNKDMHKPTMDSDAERTAAKTQYSDSSKKRHRNDEYHTFTDQKSRSTRGRSMSTKDSWKLEKQSDTGFVKKIKKTINSSSEGFDINRCSVSTDAKDRHRKLLRSLHRRSSKHNDKEKLTSRSDVSDNQRDEKSGRRISARSRSRSPKTYDSCNLSHKKSDFYSRRSDERSARNRSRSSELDSRDNSHKKSFDAGSKRSEKRFLRSRSRSFQEFDSRDKSHKKSFDNDSKRSEKRITRSRSRSPQNCDSHNKSHKRSIDIKSKRSEQRFTKSRSRSPQVYSSRDKSHERYFDNELNRSEKRFVKSRSRSPQGYNSCKKSDKRSFDIELRQLERKSSSHGKTQSKSPKVSEKVEEREKHKSSSSESSSSEESTTDSDDSDSESESE